MMAPDTPARAPRAPQPSLYPVGRGEAFGWPGRDLRWAPAAKHGVGTACSEHSRVWFTMAEGILTEIFYPRVDVANTRDLQFLVTDGASVFHEERRHLQHTVSYADPRAPAYLVASVDPLGEYLLSKVVITDPDADTVLMRVTFEAFTERARRFRLFLLAAPHVKNCSAGNAARVLASGRQRFLVASRDDLALAITTSTPFRRTSAGFVGHSDGWQDLRDNFSLDWEFATATDGHVALTGEIDLRRRRDFVVAIGFGPTDEAACRAALRSCRASFDDRLTRYVDEWREWCGGLSDLRRQARDAGRTFCTSAMVLRMHQDKATAGAGVASLSIPWGESASDANPGGYHLVWPRDLYKTAMGFLALDDTASARRILEYLQRTQAADGHWTQNYWIDGTPYWQGLQLDETSYPIILAWRLGHLGAIAADELTEMIRRAAAYLLRHGPVTDQDRWEENSGFSPSTLAAVIAALVCAADLLAASGESHAAEYLREVADSWNTQVEAWTFTTCGEILPDHPEHYERIASIAPAALASGGTECRVFLPIRNQPPTARTEISQCCVVDGGFLALVRFGLRAPDDPHVVKTVVVYDAVLRVDTAAGAVWRRYNHDGYGEKADGSPFDGSGIGRGWPLLTGERGHYELAAGRSADPYIEAMERFANEGALIPEQIWDADDIPQRALRNGKGTGAATPLVWAHAEYLMLLRSKQDGRAFERVDAVHERYVSRQQRSALRVWRSHLPVREIGANERLRIQVDAPAVVHWSPDWWMTVHDSTTAPTTLGVHYFDFPANAYSREAIVFTLFWPDDGRWEGRDYTVAIRRICQTSD
ncbi:MAG: glycoside hydrolase family 15 protein [Acidobacteriota bacterium]